MNSPRFIGFKDNRHSGSDAFTVTELLMVCVVLGILAALISAAVMSAKTKARQVQCVGNLRQHGLALNGFLTDHHEYALNMSANVKQQYPQRHRNWMGALFPEQLDQKDIFQGDMKIYDCPAASRPKEFPPNLGYADYGYNVWGLGADARDSWKGCGGDDKRGSDRC
jgi:type II secretory pathway pseudopilin PulG